MFNVGDEVEFTNDIPTVWWFGPHTEWKTGTVVSTRVYQGYDYTIKIGPKSFQIGYVHAQQIRLINYTVDYKEFQTGDTDEDI